MPWVRFTADFDWKPRPSVTTAYKAGMVQLVTQACRDAALGAGRAVETERPAGAPAVHAAADRGARHGVTNPPPAIRRRRRGGE